MTTTHLNGITVERLENQGPWQRAIVTGPDGRRRGVFRDLHGKVGRPWSWADSLVWVEQRVGAALSLAYGEAPEFPELRAGGCICSLPGAVTVGCPAEHHATIDVRT